MSTLKFVNQNSEQILLYCLKILKCVIPQKIILKIRQIFYLFKMKATFLILICSLHGISTEPVTETEEDEKVNI